jgi:hypothetical protein
VPIPVRLTIQDMYARIGARRVNGYFDDTHNGEVGDEDETNAVNDVLCAAEGMFFSYALRNWTGNPLDLGSAAIKLIDNDALLKMHIAWMACQLAAERRTEFTDTEGNGPYKAQYERATKYMDNISKGIMRSVGESEAGLGANTGGNLQPLDENGNTEAFTFAASRDRPGGPGGFIIPLAFAFELVHQLVMQLA